MLGKLSKHLHAGVRLMVDKSYLSQTGLVIFLSGTDSTIHQRKPKVIISSLKSSCSPEQTLKVKFLSVLFIFNWNF